MGRRHLEILEQDLGLRDPAKAHRGLARADDEPRRLAPHREEAADAARLAVLVHPGEDEVELRDPAARDPVLAPVEDVDVAPAVGPGRHLRRRAPRLGLGDADGGLVAAEDEFRREALLRLGPVAHDGADGTHVRFHHDASGDPAGARHLLDDEGCVEVVAPLPAVGGGDGHAHEPRIAERGHRVPRVGLTPVGFRGAGSGDLVGEGPRPRLEVQPIPIEFEHLRGLRSRATSEMWHHTGAEERCPSGRRSTPGKCVCVNSVPRVRIPPSPPSLSSLRIIRDMFSKLTPEMLYRQVRYLVAEDDQARQGREVETTEEAGERRT